MKNNISRNVHFLGSKIRSQRKSLGLTLEDLSIRCIQINPEIAPSISYLSLIETGNRVPSPKLLELFSNIFQKDLKWFLDNATDKKNRTELSKYSFEGIDFEPNFLFSKKLIKNAIPTILSQANMSGRQLAHILIRAYQEQNYNQFPSIERMANEIGKKKLPLRESDILSIIKKNGLKIKWFKRSPFKTINDLGIEINSVIRSFWGDKNTIYLNESLKKSNRLKYDLALYLGHKILHSGDGLISTHASGGEIGGSPSLNQNNSEQIKQKDILYAWRDFECSFFAGALLCPKTSLRRYLSSNAYDISCYKSLGVTPSILMRRITVVSPYKYWHYFDAYSPGYLRALYRGNRIDIPWKNKAIQIDTYNKWSVAKSLKNNLNKPLPRLTITKDKNNTYIKSSISMQVQDMSNQTHILSLGIDLKPAIKKQINNYDDFICDLSNNLDRIKKKSFIKKVYADEIKKISRKLNVKWIADSIENEVDLIDLRIMNHINEGKSAKQGVSKISWINDIKKQIIKSKK